MPVVASPQQAEVVKVFEQQAAVMRAPLLLGDRDWHVTAASTGADDTSFDLTLNITENEAVAVDTLTHRGVARLSVAEIRALRIPLRGVFQAANAATATVAALVLSRRLARIDEAAIRRGLAAIVWPGRCNNLRGSYRGAGRCAHAGICRCASACHDRPLCRRRIILVCGIQADKDIPGIAAPLAAVAARVVATAAHHRRAAAPAVIAGAFGSTGHAGVVIEAEPMAALALAKDAAGADGVVLVAGSLYLVGEILAGTGIDPWKPAGRA